MAQEERIPRSTTKESLIYTPLQVKVLPKVTKCYNEAHHGNVVTSIFFMISVFLGEGCHGQVGVRDFRSAWLELINVGICGLMNKAVSP